MNVAELITQLKALRHLHGANLNVVVTHVEYGEEFRIKHVTQAENDDEEKEIVIEIG